MDMILLGDFSRDLAKKSDDYSKHDISDALNESRQISDRLHVRAVEGSSFISQAVFGDRVNGADERIIIKKVNTLIETRDGCISSQDLKVRCLVDLNRPNAYLDVSQLSGDLKQVPEGFIESLRRDVDHVTLSAGPAIAP